MAELVWDAVGERLYETGNSQTVLYPMTNNVYGNGVAWNGVTGINHQPSGGDSSDIYADDIKYLSIRAREEMGFTITAYTYPDEFAVCDGSRDVVQGVRLYQQSRKMFGLCHKTILGNDTNDVDYGYKLHLLYGCTVNPSERNYATINESPEAIEFSWEGKTTPVPVGTISGVDYRPIGMITIDSTKVDATKLQTLLGKLYGTAQTEPMLPLPAEVISTLQLNNSNMKSFGEKNNKSFSDSDVK